MEKKDLVIGVHGSEDLEGGHYNVLSSFTRGLLRGFQHCGVQAHTTKECFQQGLAPNLTIGFNVTGNKTWDNYLKNDIPNIMWSVDSIFYQNRDVIDRYQNIPNFILFNISPSDNEPLHEFYPSLQNYHCNVAIDNILWQKEDIKKEYDMVFLSSMIDCEAALEKLKTEMPPKTFELFMIIYDTWLNSSNLSFWQLYQIFHSEGGLNLGLDQYTYLFQNMAPLVTAKKRVEMIQNLKDFNVKVFGEGPWEKYIQGKVEYMGPCELLESIEIVNKSKIALHSHPVQLSQGLHDRVLSSSALETFVISSQTESIMQEFGDSMAYFKTKDCEGLAEQAEYFLKHEDERQEKAKQACAITLQKHTFDVRAGEILNILNY